MTIILQEKLCQQAEFFALINRTWIGALNFLCDNNPRCMKNILGIDNITMMMKSIAISILSAFLIIAFPHDGHRLLVNSGFTYRIRISSNSAL